MYVKKTKQQILNGESLSYGGLTPQEAMVHLL